MANNNKLQKQQFRKKFGFLANHFQSQQFFKADIVYHLNTYIARKWRHDIRLAKLMKTTNAFEYSITFRGIRPQTNLS